MSETSIPTELYYTPEHEWLHQLSDTTIRVGVTDFAQNQLGDIVYVELPEPGTLVNQGDSIIQLESTKSVADVYAPISGTIVSANENLVSSPELINNDPYGEGWIVDIKSEKENLKIAIEKFLNSQDYYKISSEA